MEQGYHLAFGPFHFDGPPGRLWRGNQAIALRPQSLAMLRYLVEHPDRLVTKAELRQHVWAGTHVSDAVLRVSVHEIRQALGDAAAAAPPAHWRAAGGRLWRPSRGTGSPSSWSISSAEAPPFRPSAMRSRRQKTPPGAMPITKRAPPSRKASRCWPPSRRAPSAPDSNWRCSSPWGSCCGPRRGWGPRTWATSTPGPIP